MSTGTTGLVGRNPLVAVPFWMVPLLIPCKTLLSPALLVYAAASARLPGQFLGRPSFSTGTQGRVKARKLNSHLLHTTWVWALAILERSAGSALAPEAIPIECRGRPSQQMGLSACSRVSPRSRPGFGGDFGRF